MRSLRHEFSFKEKTGCSLCGRVSIECLVGGVRSLIFVSKRAVAKALGLSVGRGANVTMMAFKALKMMVANEIDTTLQGETKEFSRALAVKVLEGASLLDQHVRLRRQASRMNMHGHIEQLHSLHGPGPADDVWAFGCVISIIMQAGWPPFLEEVDTIGKMARVDHRRTLPTSYLREEVDGCLPLIMRSCFLPQAMRPNMSEVAVMLSKSLTTPLPPNWTKVDYKDYFFGTTGE